MYRFAAVAVLVLRVSAQTLDSPEELFKAAIALQQAGKLDEAIADYRLLLSKYPDIAAVLSNLGAALAAQGKFDDAVTEYKRVLAAHPDPQVELNVALAYYKSAQFAPAADTLQRVHAAAPENTQATLLLSDCYLRAGKNRQVIDLLTPLQER